MKRHKNINPNTAERMEDHYSKLIHKGERVNEWMIPSLLKFIPNKGEIIDIGCGLGSTLDLIKNKTEARLNGIDISEVAIRHCKELGIGYFEVKDACSSIGIDRYDLIINSQTLEHVDHPIAVMENMKKALKKGGVCYMTTPIPKSNLDRGVKLHWQTIEKKDYISVFGNVEFTSLTKNHLLAVYRK